MLYGNNILSEEFSVSRGLRPLINDMHRLVTDGKMPSAEYTSEQLKNDFGINFGGKLTITVTDDDDGECFCDRKGRNCSIRISRDIVNKKSAYEKIAHELTHFMRDQNYTRYDNSANWNAGLKGGENSPEQVAAHIVELYMRKELDAKVNEMYYKCVNNPKIVCDCIAYIADQEGGDVKMYYRPGDRNSILNNLFAELENTIHLGLMNEYYSKVANAVDGNTTSPIPILMQWSRQRNFPFSIKSNNEKNSKNELLQQMEAIYKEYLESLIKIGKNLIKEMVKAFFKTNDKQQQDSGATKSTQNGNQQENSEGQWNNHGADSVPESKVTNKRIIKEAKEMRADVLKFINKLEGYKTAVKNLHWSSKNLSQHKLFDDVADSLSDFQDKVSEVEQAINGRIPVNKIHGEKYTISTPQKMLADLLSDVKRFYGGLQNLGQDYIGMRSDCEAYISDIQRQQYLLDFTLKENLRRRLRNAING